MNQDSRVIAIQKWLTHHFGHDDFSLAPASSDASFRRYFRVTLEQDHWIVMDAPPEKEDTGPFINIARFFHKHHVHVPAIIAENREQGFLLLTDFGNTPYLNQLNETTADALYHDAIDGIIAIQSCPQSEIALPAYDEALLTTEMALFPEWFLSQHFGIASPDCLKQVFDLLNDNALNQPQVIVHRDYHSRNLMITTQHNPGIIDFQDAVIGPASYDLVSLLRDSYIAWPESDIHRWVTYYLSQAKQAGIIKSNVDTAQFQYWFDLMGVQRQLKILGIFCRLYYRDNKANYMADMPQTMRYLLATTGRYDSLAELHAFLQSQPQLMQLSS